MAKIVTLNYVEGNIAHMVIDNPDAKFNFLSEDFFREFTAAMDELEARKDVRGLVISSGKPDCFFAGADVKQIRFLQTQPSAAIYKVCKDGRNAINRVSKLPYPTVAAVSGVCLGGGLELTLACKYRLASTNPKTQMGVPEVLLGFIPGWGGTVRLPRLIGLQEGFTLISTGNKVDGNKAWRLGLVDETAAPADLVNRALEIARGAKPRRYNKPFKVQMMEHALATAAGRALFARQAKAIVMSQTKGKYPAPLEALKVILKTWGMPEDKAFEVENLAFARLATSSVSRNLVRVFFAETDSKKMPEGIVPEIDVKTVGVLGAGVMGAGIAQAAAYAGYKVVLKDIDQAALDKGLAAIKALFDGLVSRRKMSQAEADLKFGAVRGTLSFADMSDCDMVIEAVIEKMAVKKAVIADLDKVISKPWIFASNTSSLSVNEMATAAREPGNVAGLHFFNPVHKMKLVEVICAKTTSPATLAAVKSFGTRLGKTTVDMNDGPLFVVNRILTPYMKEAFTLFLEGVPAEVIDKAATRFGMPMGPIALMDEVGLDIVTHVINSAHAALGDRVAPPAIIKVFSEKKLLGKKGGKGIYLYDEKGKRAGVNPDIQAAIGKTGKTMTESAIQDRLFLPMVNEAALVLSEGVIEDPAQLDLAMIFGSGFAPFHGGVLGYADSVGIRTILQKLQHLHKVAGDNYRPAQLIVDKAARGEAFYAR